MHPRECNMDNTVTDAKSAKDSHDCNREKCIVCFAAVATRFGPVEFERFDDATYAYLNSAVPYKSMPYSDSIEDCAVQCAESAKCYKFLYTNNLGKCIHYGNTVERQTDDLGAEYIDYTEKGTAGKKIYSELYLAFIGF